MNFSWSIFLDLGLICLALLLATFIRSKVRFFQKFLIPNALIAGFILLPFYNYLAPRLGIGREGLDTIYRFVDMALDKRKPFFVWYAPFMPHAPHTPPDSLKEKYLPLALRYRKKTREIARTIPLDIFPLKVGVENGIFLDEIKQGEVIYERRN